jgi:membrane protein implicated in regulation of membrane protease activity
MATVAVLQALELFGLSLPVLLLLAGAGLVVAEAVAPGAHFIVIGVALLVAGLVGLVVAPALGTAAALFAMTVAVLLAGGATLWGYRRLDVYGESGAGRTSDSGSLRGQTGRVTERVTPSSGAVKLDDGGFNPNYRARTVDGEISEGEEVIVVDPGGGNVVTVEALSGGLDDIDRELAREQERRTRDSERDTEEEAA